MNYLCAALAALVLALGWLYHSANNSLADERTARTVAEEANATLTRSVDTLRSGREADNMVVRQATEQSDRMTTRARTLEHQLREAIHAQVDLDRVLSRSATDALCLRYLSAAGQDRDNRDDAAGSTPAKAPDSPPSRCDAFAGMTVSDAMEWGGFLLDHAGMERIRVDALNTWIREAKPMGKSE